MNDFANETGNAGRIWNISVCSLLLIRFGMTKGGGVVKKTNAQNHAAHRYHLDASALGAVLVDGPC
jgi:hypothetical protein